MRTKRKSHVVVSRNWGPVAVCGTMDAATAYIGRRCAEQAKHSDTLANPDSFSVRTVEVV